jgi:membrane protein
MGRIARRFTEGGHPYTALQLRQLTNIPIRVVNDLLYQLIEARLVIEVSSDEKGDTSQYMPAESLDNLNLGVLIDRLESTGKWKLDIDLHQLADNEAWGKALLMRRNYLKEQRNIKLEQL